MGPKCHDVPHYEEKDKIREELEVRGKLKRKRLQARVSGTIGNVLRW